MYLGVHCMFKDLYLHSYQTDSYNFVYVKLCAAKKMSPANLEFHNFFSYNTAQRIVLIFM